MAREIVYVNPGDILYYVKGGKEIVQVKVVETCTIYTNPIDPNGFCWSRFRDLNGLDEVSIPTDEEYELKDPSCVKDMGPVNQWCWVDAGIDEVSVNCPLDEVFDSLEKAQEHLKNRDEIFG